MSKVNITPEESVHLASYSRDKHSQGVHGSHYVRVLALDDSEQRLAIFGCDLIGYSNPHIRNIARDRWGFDQVLFNGIHSHSTPDLRWEPGYARIVESAILRALEDAVDNLFPARIVAGHGNQLPAPGYNRLTNNSPILMSYACHAVASRINYHISADYPGVANAEVERVFGQQSARD